MATWVEMTFPIDLKASAATVESALTHLQGYPGLGPAELDTGRHVAHLRHDATCIDGPSLLGLLRHLDVPLILDPLPRYTA